MDAALILLAIVAAGQAGWAPERTASPPPATAPDYDRYAQPPAFGTSGASGVAPPPSMADRTRTASTDSRAAPRDGLEAGIQAAASRTRSGVTPPPWNDPSATSAPDWDAEAPAFDPPLGRTSLPALEPIRTNSGWTSIGSQVAAPPLLVPRLTTSARTAPPRDPSASSGPSLTAPIGGREPIQSLSVDASQQRTPPAAGADSWATGWGNNTSAATISRSDADTSSRSGRRGDDLVQVQAANQRPQDSSPNQPPAAGNWGDLWGDKDPWEDSPQTSPAATPPQQAATGTAPATSNPANPPFIAPPANNISMPTAGTGVLQSGAGAPALRGAASPTTAAEQPPWLPLLVVSLSLAGSLGANLFLGWSYFDARQKYQSLVRKTADKFRRAAKAAA